MQIIYVSTSMDTGDFAELFRDSKTMPGQQGPKFNRLLIEGLAANGVHVRACTGRPVTGANCAELFLPAKTHVKSPRLTYYYGSILNLPVVKNLWQMASAYVSVLTGKEAGAVVCDVLNASIAFGASLAAKHRGIPCVGIVTDLPELMVTGTRKGHIRLVEKCIRNCTAYVLLTQAMNEKVNPVQKPYIIIEGLCDSQMDHEKKPALSSPVKKCMYAGLLDARYGVQALVDGFVQAAVPDTELHIYGSGPYEQTLLQVAREHPQVVYHGVVMNSEVVQAELEADLLINPRPTHEEFTKYSFPSKNMEYMASGTAVLTTRLPGMPEEYCHYVYLAEEESAEGMAAVLRQILAQDRETLNRMGASGREFVLSRKNNIAQAARLLELIP